MIPADKVYDGNGFGVFVRSDLVVVDHNSECADMDNPRGEIYGEMYYVVIERGDGFRWASRKTFKTDWEADSKASLTADLLADMGYFNLDNWAEIDPCYGSEAYQALGIEAERVFEDQNPDDSRYNPGRWY